MPDGVPAWLLALVPIAVLAILVTNLVVRSRRGDFGREADGRRRAPWLWPVLIGAGAFAILSLFADR